MQRLKAVESITWSLWVSASEKVSRSKRFAFGSVFGIAIVNAVHFRRLQNDIGANLARAERGRGVGREIGIAGAGHENDDASQLEVTDGATRE